jgi:hypothetical protein
MNGPLICFGRFEKWVFSLCPGVSTKLSYALALPKRSTMKKVALLFSSLLLAGFVVTTSGQTSTCRHPVGTWRSDSNSQVTISQVDSTTGEIKGTYHSGLREVTQSTPLSGWLTVWPDTNDQGQTALTLTSRTGLDGYVISWTGYCREEQGIPTIRALSEKASVRPDSGQGRVLTEMTVWVYSSASEPAQRMALMSGERTAPATGIGSASCPYEGKTKSGAPPAAKLVALDLLKNRANEPGSGNLNTGVTLAGMLHSKDNPNAFDEHQGATITGILFDVKAEKGETCNCFSTNPNDWDYHIYIGNANAKTIFDCAVVEMTPYSRSIHPEWTLAYVKSLKGKQVRVTGWLLFDFEHLGQSFETNPNTGAPNRHTVWEIHPVTALN